MPYPDTMKDHDRLAHIDALRGFAIMMVVYVHLVNYGLFDLRADWMQCAWSPAVVGMRFRMPLFFFVSGLLACTAYTPSVFRRRVAARLRRQLWPTVAACLIFNLAVNGWHGWERLGYSPLNERYWFTQSLVQVFLVYALLARGFDRLKSTRATQTVVLGLLIALLWGAWIWVQSYGKLPKGHFLNYTYLNRTVLYAQFFLDGGIGKDVERKIRLDI